MAKPNAPARLDLLGIIAGHYAGEILLGLSRSGALELLAAGIEIDALGRATNLDPRHVALLFDFLARTTTIVARDRRGHFRLVNSSVAEATFQLQKFIGAYGSAVRGLPPPMRGATAGSMVDEHALAAAFAAAADIPSHIAAQLRRAGYQCVLDLGCGPAALLIEMARADTGFRGIGIDQGRAMCRIARKRAHEAGVTSRIKILCADVRNICNVLDERLRDRVDAVHARSVLNAFFGRGSGTAIAFLQELRAAFPGRIAFFVDYYGELGHSRNLRRGFRLAELQDVAQLASGQGIPPATRRQWHVLYQKAGCTLLSADDRQQDEIRWFIHKVQLAG